MFRLSVSGGSRASDQLRIYQAKSQQAGRLHYKATCSDCIGRFSRAMARRRCDGRGIDDAFGHGLGLGLGNGIGIGIGHRYGYGRGRDLGRGLGNGLICENDGHDLGREQ